MRLYVAGHTGLVGSALMRRFSARRDVTLLTAARAELDLTDAQAVHQWLARTRPDAVIIAAGRTELHFGVHQYLTDDDIEYAAESIRRFFE